MKLLPESILDYSDLKVLCEDTTYEDILEWIVDRLYSSDYKSVELDMTDEDGLILIKIKKKKIVEFLEEIQQISQQVEYDKKYMALRERVGDKVVEYLIGTPIDPDKLIKYLPSKELIDEDYKLYQKLFGLSCGYYTPDEGLLSIELAKQLAIGKSIDEYPEKLDYHFYWYPKETKSVCEASFTKSEFLDSIKKEQSKLLIKK